MVVRRFPELSSCVGSAEVRSRLNKSLRWAVRNRLPVLTPQLYLAGVKLCDEDVDLGVDFALTRMIERYEKGTLRGALRAPAAPPQQPPAAQPASGSRTGGAERPGAPSAAGSTGGRASPPAAEGAPHITTTESEKADAGVGTAETEASPDAEVSQ